MGEKATRFAARRTAGNVLLVLPVLLCLLLMVGAGGALLAGAGRLVIPALGGAFWLAGVASLSWCVGATQVRNHKSMAYWPLGAFSDRNLNVIFLSGIVVCLLGIVLLFVADLWVGVLATVGALLGMRFVGRMWVWILCGESE